jgi:hypothetical protein
MLRGMKIYTVHIRPIDDGDEMPLFVREGFSFFAFLFHFFWAFYHRLWKAGLMIAAAYIAVGMLGEFGILSQRGMIATQLGIQVIIGFHANDWLRAGLARRGYIMTDITTGDSLLRAEQRYFERSLATAH